MTMFQLTLSADNLGQGARPILINPEHVVSVRPRRGTRPSGVSQTPNVSPVSMGTEISLVNGETHTVIEPYDQVAKRLTTIRPPAASALQPQEPIKAKPVEKREPVKINEG